MADITDLSAKRWDKNSDPAQNRPDEALQAALRYIAEHEMPDHIIVVFGRFSTENNCDATKFFQAGSYKYHAQMGLMFEGQQLVRESGYVGD